MSIQQGLNAVELLSIARDIWIIAEPIDHFEGCGDAFLANATAQRGQRVSHELHKRVGHVLSIVQFSGTHIAHNY
eukprot:3221519-Amphidinium_carterae.2